ncbi:MAG: hypothetical protein ACKV22_04280 [Bryobacteraceae bacterium]
MAINLSRELAVRWNHVENPEKAVPLLRQAGVTVVVPSKADEKFTGACKQAGLRVLLPGEIHSTSLAESEKADPKATVVLKDGIWPGVRKDPNQAGRGDETASASRDPWLDANGFWVGVARALHPSRYAVLGYSSPGPSEMVPFDTHEMALIEARTSGGNCLIDINDRFSRALAAGDAKALAAWRDLGSTARWLGQHANLFGQPTLPAITVLVDHGDATAELVNLMYRRNASPALADASNPPPPHPDRLVVVGADLVNPTAETRAKLLDHARAGASVILTGAADPGWKTIRAQEDRTFYQAGKGQVVLYKEAIADPSEFALDVIDILTHKNRAVRMWNASTVIPLVTSAPRGSSAKAILSAVNYGEPIEDEIQVRVHGDYRTATLLRPEGASTPLKTARRGPTTEVFVSGMRRLAVVLFA